MSDHAFIIICIILFSLLLPCYTGKAIRKRNEKKTEIEKSVEKSIDAIIREIDFNQRPKI